MQHEKYVFQLKDDHKLKLSEDVNDDDVNLEWIKSF